MKAPAERLEAHPPSPEGATVGRYQVEALLGRGGMGAVYRARDRSSGRQVALKTLESEADQARGLFELEYQTLAAISHPCVIQTLDYGVTDDGFRYYAMELVEGQDLNAASPLPWAELVVHLRDVASALSLLHRRGLVHRDVSPRNIRIDETGRARLLDFGALAPFGPTSTIVGTPACIAPEAAQQRVIDGRADLFSLGVTAYIALTGRKPFDIRSLRTVEAAHAAPPRDLRDLVPEIPEALAELIAAMVQVDVRRRPVSAEEVIERLGVLGALGVVTERRESQIPMGQFSSPAIAGRKRELDQIKHHLARLFDGEGTALVIEGASRLGKSRLAKELAVEARVMGATVVRIEGGSHGPLGVTYRELVRKLASAMPDEVTSCLRAEPAVARLLDRPSHDVPADQGSLSPSELASELQAAVVRFVQALAKRRVLVIVVDDAHALDAASSGVAFALAHGVSDSQILLAMTFASEAKLSTASRRTIDLCARIKLRPLDSSSVKALVESIFGRLAHGARLCQWVGAVSGGNPGHALDLMQELVRRGVIRWLSGSWSLPQELPQDQLPASIEDALSGEIDQLSSSARELAQLIAMQDSSVPLSLCRRLMKDRDEDAVIELCRALLSARVVTLVNAGYRISHDSYRKLLLDGLPEQSEERLHRLTGQALLADVGYQESEQESHKALSDLPAEQLNACLRAGWHLVRGGEVARGQQLLKTMGLLLTHRGEGLADAIPALEGAVAAARRAQGQQDTAPASISPLVAALTLAGSYINPQLTYRYGFVALEIVVEASGLGIATRLAKLMPRRLAVYLALGFGALRMPLTSRRQVATDFKEVMLAVVGLGSAVLGTFSTLADGEGAKRLMKQLRPLGWFPKRHPAAMAYQLQQALASAAAGSYVACLAHSEAVRPLLEDASVRRKIPPSSLKQFEVGTLIVSASMEVYRGNSQALKAIARLQQLDTPIARESAAGLRASYHAHRGEMHLHTEYREMVDVLAAQGGSPWQQDVMIARQRWWVESQCEDLLSLKRSTRQLETIASDHPAMKSTHAAAHASYLAERGLAGEALTRYGQTLELAAAQPGVLSNVFAAVYARVLRRAGQADRALSVCRQAVEGMSPEDRTFICLCLGVQLELGRALVALGEVSSAAAHVDRVVEDQLEHDNPLLRALSHLARAEIAVVQLDQTILAEQMKKAEPSIAATEYSALFGLAQRLRARARAAGMQTDCSELSPQGDSVAAASCRTILRAISGCRGMAERQQLALDTLIEQSRAAGGYLYLVNGEGDGGGLRFAAPLHGVEPAGDLQEEIEQRARDWQSEEMGPTVTDFHSEMQTVVGVAEQQDPTIGCDARVGSSYRIAYLSMPVRGSLQLVGVAALVEGTQPFVEAPQPVLEAIAMGVYDAGDATAMHGA